MPEIAAIKGILFDKDGTLIDFNRTWFEVIMALARKASSGDEALARTLMQRGGYHWTLKRFVSGSAVAAGTVEDLVDLWHPHLTPSERQSRITQYDRFTIDAGSGQAAPIEGLHATLNHLVNQGFVLGIATNDSEAGARATATALGLDDLFTAIIGYDSVARAKPHADQLHLFAAKTGLLPAQIAMVGDNPHDLEMAHAAGAGLAIGVLSGNSTQEELVGLSDLILGSIAELPAVFGPI